MKNIDTFELPDYRTVVWTGSAYELTEVMIPVEEPLGSYIFDNSQHI